MKSELLKEPKTKLTIHAAADVFPMLPEDELNELAADIKANGLREPIKVSGGVLVDGRNRLKACEIAGVEPAFEDLNGVDVEGYILSVNINRRHLTKGQRAMATAMIRPEPSKGGRGNKTPALSADLCGARYLTMARTVLATLPEQAKQVIAGAISLNEAYEKAQFQRQSGESAAASVQSLRKAAPDLADLVDEERMKLTEALAALEKRKSEERAQREAIYGLLERERMFLSSIQGKNLTGMIAVIQKHPEECSLVEIKKLANQMAAAWSKLEEGLK